MTSRTPLLDQLLAIRNLLALNDHELEQIVNLRQEQQEGASLSVPTTQDTLTPTLDADALYDSYTKDINATIRQYNDHYQLRKELQRALFDSYDIDLSYRCQFKHRLTIHEALKEIADATNSPSDRERYYLFTNDLYLWLGEITGLWHTPCGRCLLDAEQSEPTKETPSTSTVSSPSAPQVGVVWPASKKTLWEVLDSIFADLSKGEVGKTPTAYKLEDLNSLLVKFFYDYFDLCTEKEFSAVLGIADSQYPDLHFIEDKILWYLVETRKNIYPEWLSVKELQKLLDFPPAIPLYAYVMSYHLYSDKSLTLSEFVNRIYQDKPSLVFTGDFRVKDPITPFLLYTFKPMGQLLEPEIVQAGRYFWNNPTLGKMVILKKRANQNLTFSQAYPEDHKYKLISDPYLRTFFSVDYYDDLMKGSDFPKHSTSDFHLPDVSANKAKELRILLYLASPRKVPFRTWERDYLTGDDRNLETLLKINRI